MRVDKLLFQVQLEGRPTQAPCRTNPKQAAEDTGGNLRPMDRGTRANRAGDPRGSINAADRMRHRLRLPEYGGKRCGSTPQGAGSRESRNGAAAAGTLQRRVRRTGPAIREGRPGTARRGDRRTDRGSVLRMVHTTERGRVPRGEAGGSTHRKNSESWPALLREASNDMLALAYLQGAFTWRQMATMLRRSRAYGAGSRITSTGTRGTRNRAATRFGRETSGRQGAGRNRDDRDCDVHRHRRGDRRRGR